MVIDGKTIFELRAIARIISREFFLKVTIV